MTNNVIYRLNKIKAAGIDYFKMQRHYGFVGNFLAQPNNILGYIQNKFKSFRQLNFPRNYQRARGEINSGNQYRNHFDEELSIRLKSAIDFCGQDKALFKSFPSMTLISNFLPRYDKTSADLRLYKILKILLANKCKIEYIYSGKTSDDRKYANNFRGDITFRRLSLRQNDYCKIICKNPNDYLWITNLWRNDYVKFMAQLITILKKNNPSFKIIIDTMDFHYKEFMRKFQLTNNPKDLVRANEFLKNEKILNMVMLGALIKITNLVSREAIIRTINETLPSHLCNLNINAFNRGYESL